MTVRAVIASLLSIVLGLQFPAARMMAQEPQTGPPPTKLNIVIVEGEGAINNIKQRTAREPIVQVEDENRKPVAGAAVVFALPGNGASGAFANGSRLLTVLTDNTGRAAMRGFTPNDVSGQLQIRVTASFRGQTATANIMQTNALIGASAGIGTGKIIAIIAVVGGAAAGGAAYAATRGSSTPTTVIQTPATVISPGSPTVGPPR